MMILFIYHGVGANCGIPIFLWCWGFILAQAFINVTDYLLELYWGNDDRQCYNFCLLNLISYGGFISW